MCLAFVLALDVRIVRQLNGVMQLEVSEVDERRHAFVSLPLCHVQGELAQFLK